MLGFLYAFLLGGLALAAGGGSSSAGSTPSAGSVPNPQPMPQAQSDDDDDDVEDDNEPPANNDNSAGNDSSGGPVDAGVPDLPNSAYNIGWNGLTAEEQLMVELVNRARLDPLEEVDRLDEGLASGIPARSVQALAVIDELSDAARGHSEDMDNRDFFDHVNPDNDGPGARAIDAGYGSGFVGENIGWIGSTFQPDAQFRTESHHENLWESDGHQRNLMDDDWSEIGMGYDYGGYRGYNHSTFVTELFGDKGNTFLTGVVIDDEDGDDFYDLGEGQGDVKITAFDGEDAFATATWDSGGYTLALPPGTYRVVFEGGDLDQPYATDVTIGNENVKLDVIEDNGNVLASLNAGTPLPGLLLDDTETLAFVEDAEDDMELFEMV